MSKPRHALVLTAGLGTRLRPLTLVRAKPAIPVAGVPLVRRILAWLASEGVNEAVLNLHYLPATITTLVGDGRDLGVHVRYSWEQPNVLGSAGGPRLALPIIGADPFFIVNGDTLTDVDLAGLAAAHESSRALVTLALTPNVDYLRYGGVTLDSRSRVTGAVRKGEGARRSFHFLGVQIASAAAFESIEPGKAANSIGGTYDDLMTRVPGSVGGFITDAAFYDIGTIEDYLQTSASLDQNTGPVDDTVRIDPTARVTDSLVWSGVTVEAGARVEHCVVTDRVRVPAGAEYRHEILIEHSSSIVSIPLALRVEKT